MINPVETNKPLIRLGDDADGGYLIPNDLEGIRACFSPGVSCEASFELDLASRQIKSYLADYSVSSAPFQNDLIDFEKKYLGTEITEMFMTLESWMQRKEPNGSDFILQMDIEGAEFPVIYQTPTEVLSKFRILVIEFHGLDNIYSQGGYDLIYLTFQKILMNFEIVHIHPNNVCRPVVMGSYSIPPVMEFSFLRKDRISSKSKIVNFPHQLDVKNFNAREDVILPACWRGC